MKNQLLLKNGRLGEVPYHSCQSPLEKLPSEILHKIFMNLEVSHQICDDEDSIQGILKFIPVRNQTNEITELKQKDLNTCLYRSTLISCLLTSRTINAVTLPIIYRNVTLSQLSTSRSFAFQIRKDRSCGRHVRKLDLSQIHFKHIHSDKGYTEITSSLIQSLTLIPLLREFRAPQDTEGIITEQVLQKLLLELPHLQVLDLSNCASPSFAEAFSSLVSHLSTTCTLPLTNLTITNPFIPSEAFEYLIPHLHSIQFLSLVRTNIKVSALSLLPTAHLMHLNISHCSLLEGSSLITFLSSHRSTKDSLASLNATTSTKSTTPIFTESDTESLLRNIPACLQKLHLGGWKMNSTCIHLLASRMSNLEELSIGTGLHFRDLERLFLDSSAEFEEKTDATESEDDDKLSPTLSTMHTAVAICKLRLRLNSTPTPLPKQSRLQKLDYLDIRSMDVLEQRKVKKSILLGAHSEKLRIIELSEKFLGGIGVGSVEEIRKVVGSVGWKVERWGQRAVFVREKSEEKI